MKTIIATALFLTTFASQSMAQNSWKPEPTNKYRIEEAPAELLSRSETYFGADLNYSSDGAKISFISPNSPAEKFNFMKGDIINSIGGITINSEESFKKAMAAHQPEEIVKVSFTRKNNQKNRKVRLEKITFYKNAGTN